MTDTRPPVRVTCAFDVTPGRLFDAWLDPAIARRWLFTTDDGEMASAEIDPRVDGTFAIVERRGADAHVGAYLLIDRPNRLAFSLDPPGLGGAKTVVSVAIMQVGDRVSILSLTHEGLPAGTTAWSEMRWSRMLDRLAITLERLAGDGSPAVP